MFTKTSRKRLAFTRLWGKLVSRVAKMTAEGKNAHQVSNKLGIPVTSVAAYKAHLTRGTYSPWVDGCEY